MELLGEEEDGALLGAGYAICFVVAVEGALFLLASFAGWLGVHTQMGGILSSVLKVLGFGDVAFAIVGALGLWLCSSALLPLSVEAFQKRHSCVSTSCVAALLVWRCLATLCTAPCLGVLLAFPSSALPLLPAFCLALLYMVVSVGILCALVFILRAVAVRSRLLQLETDLWAAADRKAEERRKRFWRVRLPSGEAGEALVPPGGELFEDEGTLFHCLPLTGVLQCYLFVVSTLTAIWFSELCILSQKTVGGWAFLTAVPWSRGGWWLELFLYLFAFIVAFTAALSLLFYRRARETARQIACQLIEEGSDAAVEPSQTCARELRVLRFSAKVVLVCAVMNAIRVAIFFPVSGAALFAKNVCSVHAHAYVSIATIKAPYAGSIPLSCTGIDVAILVLVALVVVLDVYLAIGLGWFCWQHFLRAQGPEGLAQAQPGYGATSYVASGRLASEADGSKESWLKSALQRIEKRADARASEVLRPVQAPREQLRSFQSLPPTRATDPGSFQPMASASAFQPLASAPPTYQAASPGPLQPAASAPTVQPLASSPPMFQAAGPQTTSAPTFQPLASSPPTCQAAGQGPLQPMASAPAFQPLASAPPTCQS